MLKKTFSRLYTLTVQYQVHKNFNVIDSAIAKICDIQAPTVSWFLCSFVAATHCIFLQCYIACVPRSTVNR